VDEFGRNAEGGSENLVRYSKMQLRMYSKMSGVIGGQQAALTNREHRGL
jgi:hypothetical protein